MFVILLLQVIGVLAIGAAAATNTQESNGPYSHASVTGNRNGKGAVLSASHLGAFRKDDDARTFAGPAAAFRFMRDAADFIAGKVKTSKMANAKDMPTAGVEGVAAPMQQQQQQQQPQVTLTLPGGDKMTYRPPVQEQGPGTDALAAELSKAILLELTDDDSK